MLIYAAGEGEPGRYRVPLAGKHLDVETIDVAGPPAAILGEINRIAQCVGVSNSIGDRI